MIVCAYCQEKCYPTREHIIPAFMYAFMKQLEYSVIGWNEVAQKMLSEEGKIKDVCASCNNNILGYLDSYGKQLLSDSGLLVPNYTKTTLALKYDYSLLLRWLLKVSFNSSRRDGAHAPLFKEHIPFMLGLSKPPPRHRVATVLYLARPELFNKFNFSSDKLKSLSQDSDLLNPFFVRVCYGLMPGEHRFVLRLNIFGPAVFNILIFHNDVLPGHAAVAIRSFLKTYPNSVELDAKRKLVVVNAGKKSWLDLYEPQILRTIALGEGN